MNEFKLNGVTYVAARPPFSASVNKCTGCAFHADKKQCTQVPTCLASLRPDFSDVIYEVKQ